MGSCCSSLEEPSPPYNATATPKRDYCTPEQPPAYAPRAITVRRDYPTRAVSPPRSQGPFYGEYKCGKCGRHWPSRLSWPDSYQLCKRCRCRVYPYSQRELRSGDLTKDPDSSKDHPKEFCGKCQALGRYCNPGANKIKQRY
ncbi:hypothetical protein JYU34_018047 [Plutella xylostella]|uniref:3CxxC-type domain-containing protein n=1 Tax=Plutella xylostella TaxID=51655 RepID=A0ABQ7PZK6_PLUXY|nr:hypothetical protein JYU34_018047 [Plutella xylostella]